jgi:predicted nucleotidyltransferase
MTHRERLIAIAERLRRDYSAERVLLYGSVARGEATEDSDVDLLVIAPTKEPFYDRMATVRRIVRHLRAGLVLSPIVLTPQEVQTRLERGDQFVQEILQEGIEL